MPKYPPNRRIFQHDTFGVRSLAVSWGDHRRPYLNVTDRRTGRATHEGLAVGQHLVVIMRLADAKTFFDKGGTLRFYIQEKYKPTSLHPSSRMLPLTREDFHCDAPVN